MLTSLIVSAFLTLTSQKDMADRMLMLATADQPLAHSVIVDAPVAEVWKAWTTKEGITSWMVASGDVDLRVGGKMRTSYAKGSDLQGPDAIENTIISFDPERMLSIKTTKTPEKFPWKTAMSHAWTVIYFQPVEKGKTQVLVRMLGYDGTTESTAMRTFFNQGNQATLNALAKKFAK